MTEDESLFMKILFDSFDYWDWVIWLSLMDIFNGNKIKPFINRIDKMKYYYEKGDKRGKKLVWWKDNLNE